MKKYRICVIGLGYVGLPLANSLSEFYEVIGYDTNNKRIKEISECYDRTGELKTSTLQKTSLEVTSNPEKLSNINIYIITVPTPINNKKKPDLTAIFEASEFVGTLIQKGAIVVYESTVYPGVTEEECGPIIEKASGLKSGKDFWLGYSPESIRYLLLSGHYRTKISWSESKKREGERIVKRLSEFKMRLFEKGADSLGDKNYPKEYYDFIDKLDDDLDAPGALAVFFKWMRMQNEKLRNKIEDPLTLSQAWSFLSAFDSIFGVIKSESENVPLEIKKLLEKRRISREEKDWVTADQIRKVVEDKGWGVEDIGTGYRAKKLNS